MPSKISRLSQPLRDELNRRLADNESSATLLPWLNRLPAVCALLAAEFGSRPISKVNLSKWRAHGFAAWQLRREMLAQSRPVTVEPTPSVPSVASVPDPAPQWSEHLSQLLAMHYFSAVASWDGHSDALCRPQFRALRALCREVHQLRHADQARRRLQLQRDLLVSQTAIYPPKTVQISSGKSAKTPAKAHIVNPGKPQFFLPPPSGPIAPATPPIPYRFPIDDPFHISNNNPQGSHDPRDSIHVHRRL